MTGVVLRPDDTLLVRRARELLARGAVDAATLFRHIAQMPSLPPAVADHLALTLLGGHPEFARDRIGRWAIAAPRPLATPRGESLRRLSYVVVDLETTGGSAHNGHRITELCAVIVRDGAVVEVFESLVNPERSIPPWVSRLTNITWEMVRDQPTFRDLCADVLRLVEGQVFVAHNATFDWNFLAHEVRRVTGRELDGRRLCTVRLARRLLPQLRRRNLDHLCHHYGIEITARHRAGGDARATAAAFLRLLGEAAARGVSDWEDLQRLLGARARGRRRRRSGMPGPVDRDTTA